MVCLFQLFLLSFTTCWQNDFWDHGMRTLIVGWFSFPDMAATVGDLACATVVSKWLDDKPHDILIAPPNGSDNWRTVDPSRYTHVVFVCGPFGPDWQTEFWNRFAACRKIAINISPLGQPLIFDAVISRDDHPDLSLSAPVNHVPLVGLCLVHPQPEYGERGRHSDVEKVVREYLKDVAVVEVDTRIDQTPKSLAQVETVLARMDYVVTTRLHGLVLSLKNGVPAVAVDCISGGAKVYHQAVTLGWPAVLKTDQLAELAEWAGWCLTPEARDTARRCAAVDLNPVREKFLRFFSCKT